MSKQAIIFDFDGTLANTAHLIQKIYNQMAIENGWPVMSSKDYLRLRKGTLVQALKWSGIHTCQLPFLLREGWGRFFKEAAEIKLFTGMDKVIIQLSEAGFDLYILSLNSEKSVNIVLLGAGLRDYLTILPRASLRGKHRNIKKFLKKYSYQPDKVWMVGDELRDIEASKKAGIHSVAVTWGLQDKKLLSSAAPDVVADNPNDILRELC